MIHHVQIHLPVYRLKQKINLKIQILQFGIHLKSLCQKLF